MKKILDFNAMPTLVALAMVFTFPLLTVPSLAIGQTTSTFTYTSSAAVSGSVSCVNLSYNLYFGARDSFTRGQVTQLQVFLRAQGHYSGPITGYYGSMTYSAVARYQRAHGISGTGYVGILTRASIRNVSCSVTPVPTRPVISSLGPTSGAVGTTVTVSGSGFTSNNTVQFNGGVVPNVVSNNGTTLTFAVPAYLNPECYYTYPQCQTFAAPPAVTPGTYNVSIKNSNGTSNVVTFVVTSGSTTGVPAVTYLAPSSGPVGTTVTINGSGFTSDNNVKFDIGAFTHVVAGNNGTTLTFTIPSYIGYSCAYNQPNCVVPLLAKQIQPGTYNVSVENANGLSNTLTFTVTGGTTINSPRITSISPTSGAIGTQVSLMGTNFTSDSKVNFSGGIVQPVVTGDGRMLSFTVPGYLEPACRYSNPPCMMSMPTQQIQPGTYSVSVQNSNGTSNAVNFTITGNTTWPYGQSPTISSVSGPSQLSVNQSGTWSITARDPMNGQLTYSVVWGDENYYAYSSSPAYYMPPQQTSTFTHTYSQPGTYTVRFTVTNNAGMTAQSTMTVYVTSGYGWYGY